jgi:cell division protein FtsW (lipid II flippase)
MNDRKPIDLSKQKRRASLPIQPQDFIVSVKGREYGWLSRLVGWILAPFVRRRFRRKFEDE